ncbi:MAG TPA: hypothetical protein VL020_04980 [Pseudomonadales bacterium]|nr:hypothetical protein [Pseudomonadales bacterium]
MTNVKRVFFITKEERIALGDLYVTENMPHYELEDGTILYTKAGGPSSIEHWVEPLKVKD